jgi:predicted transcriptional regulator/DNA-binding XRE family transcriptional regulator
MSDRKIFIGARLRALRADSRLTQAELAARLEISPSYVNQLELNQRPLTATVMVALARNFNLDLSRLLADDSDRLVADLREVMVDPVFGDTPPGLQELKTLAHNAPDMARAMLQLYQTYRKTNERLASVDAVLTQDPSGGTLSPYEQVRDFFHYADNYIDGLDRAAERTAAAIGSAGPDRLQRLIAYCRRHHDLEVTLTNDGPPELIRDFDRARNLLLVNARQEASSQFFHIAAVLGDITQSPLIAELLDAANFSTQEARAICQMGLSNYFAGALQLPYAAFLAAAETARYDIEALAHLFGASFEQVAHRLSTMQRPMQRGVPFFFARVDAAGTITKRHSATPLQFARFGGACPLWNVHRAFESHGRIQRQLAETPDGNRYLSLAWSSEKRSGFYGGITRRYAYALGCEISHVGRLVEPLGIACRICERRNCPQRSVPPLAASIAINADRRMIVPYEIS